MANLSQRIQALEKKLKSLDALLVITEQEVNNLQKERKLDKTQIKSQEKSLEAWRKKLEFCQQEKNTLEQELMAQIAELKKPELSETEKQTSLNYLLGGQKQALERLEKHLYDERTHYRQIRDQLINKLCEPCEVCREKEQNLQQKVQKINNLFITIWTMLILFFCFHIWLFWFAVPRYIKKIRERTLKK